VPDSYAGTKGSFKTTTWARWQLMRYTPPASIRSLVTLAGAWSPQYGSFNGQVQPSSQAACANSGRCDLVPIAQCTIAQDGGDQNGSVAFDGSELLYSVSGERGPRPYTAVLHRVKPAGCTGTGAALDQAGIITVQFAAAEYDQARSLTWLDDGWQGFISQPAVDATNPSIDTIAYDATHDRIYFTLAASPIPNTSGTGQTGVRQENQLSLWSADLHSQAGVPAAVITARLVTVDTGYCPPTGGGGNPGSGSETLAFDRVDGSVWACLPGRPAKLDAAGNQVDESCYETPDIQGNDLSGFHVFSWSMQDLQPGGGRNRALLLEDTNNGDSRLVQFDLASCQEGRYYQLLDTPKLRSARGSMSLACDPVTFGTGTLSPNTAAETALEAKYPGITFAGTPLGAVMWAKNGDQLTALLLPDNGDGLAQQTEGGAAAALQDAQTCRLPLDLAISTPASASRGGVAPVCATLSVQGPGAPVAGQAITAAVDGFDVTARLGGGGVTDRSGRICLDNLALADGRHTVTFAYRPAANDLAYLPATAAADLLVGLAAVQLGGDNAPPRLPIRGGPTVQVVPLLVPIPANASAKTGAPAIQGQVQSVAQAQAQPAAAQEREEQKELAFAYEMPDEEQAADEARPPGESPQDGYPMTALGRQNGGGLLAGGAITPSTLAGALAMALALRWSQARRRQRARGYATRRRR
jgi:hypothetical protein